MDKKIITQRKKVKGSLEVKIRISKNHNKENLLNENRTKQKSC